MLWGRQGKGWHSQHHETDQTGGGRGGGCGCYEGEGEGPGAGGQTQSWFLSQHLQVGPRQALQATYNPGELLQDVLGRENEGPAQWKAAP